MKAAIGFGCAASIAAVVGVAALSPLFLGPDRVAADWAARGFLAVAVPGIAGGMWLVREHGRDGSGFVWALGAGFVARLVLAAICAFGASKAGNSATTGLVSGLAAGFVPVTALEMVWCARARTRSVVATERRG